MNIEHRTSNIEHRTGKRRASFLSFSLSPILSLIVLLLASCATKTSLTEVWVDKPLPAQKMQNIMVLAVSENDTDRKLFEDEFVKKLTEAGIVAHPSYRVMPTDEALEKDEIAAKVREQGADALMITHLLGADQQQVYFPPTVTAYPYGGYSPYGYQGYYSMTYGLHTSPGYSSTYINYRLETTLFDAKSEKPLWTGKTTTMDPMSIRDGVDSLSEKVIKDLQEKGLI